MSLTGVLLRHDSQAEIAIMKLEENCIGGGQAGRESGSSIASSEVKPRKMTG